MKRFTEEHEWVELSGGVATVGITAHAAKELGDVTFIELPEVGIAFQQGDILGVVESVKAAADIFCPIGGTVAAVNEPLTETPEIINESPEHRGWICKLSQVQQSDFDGLMNEDEYEEFVSHKA